MKNKKNLGSKIAIGIVSFVVLLMICLSPNLIRKLSGNINSTNTTTNEAVNTGVVLNLNKTWDYSNNNPIVIKVYNGSDVAININSIISRLYCENNGDCGEYIVTNLDTPITVEPNEEKKYTVEESMLPHSSVLFDVGVQYSMVTDENGTAVTKTYNITSLSIGINNFISELNSSGMTRGESKEFVINSSADASGKDNVYIKLSDTNIHMDKTESLDDLSVYYNIKSGFGNKWFYDHPQTEDATTNKLMFGKENKSNIKKYFSYTSPTDRKTGSGSFEYDSNYTNGFKLTGTPNNTYDKVDVVLGFYFEQYKDSTFGGYEHYSDETSPFSSSEIPHFTLTVYDKSELKAALESAVKKLSKLDEEVDQDSWLNYVFQFSLANSLYGSSEEYKYYTNFLDGYYGRNYEMREVTQTEIDNMISVLNNTTIEQKSSADYSALSNLVKTIQSKQESWYTPESYSEFKNVYDERTNYENLSSAYQVRVNNYVTRLQTAYDKLVMYDADYSAVDAAITSANNVENTTPDGKYELYTKESWNALLDAINSIDRSLKVENQGVVDSYAVAISTAHANLEVAPAIYDKLNDIIAEYKDTEAYTNNWYTDETKNPVEEYLETITFDKKITEQSVVDTWVEELTPLVKALKLKKALGYLDKDNYTPFEGALSLEGYIKYFKEIDRNLYTNEALAVVDEIIQMYEDGTAEIFNLTIDRQEELDTFLREIDNFIKNGLEKKPGNYIKLCDYYKQALNLNLDYYENISDLRQALWDINWDYKIDEQDKIDEETENLRKTINNLVMKSADYTEFNKAYESAKNLNSNYYVDFSKVQTAISNANKAKGLKIDKQKVVDEATNALNKAMDTLTLKNADYSKINTLKSIIEQLDDSKYTNFDIVKKALNAVEYGKKADEQKLVDQMYNELSNAYNNLQKTRANYSELEKAVAKVKEYEPNKSNYTNYSEIEKIINSINYTLTWEDQVKVDELTKKINDTISKLNKKSANYSELSSILSKIPSDYSEFDKALQDEIKLLLNEAKALPSDLKIDEQSKIDILVSKGKLLLEKLPSSNTYENSNNVVLSYLKVNGNKVDISKAPFKYTVEYGVVEAKITVGLASSSSTSRVYGGNVLMPGDNNITIVVTTKDGKSYTYTLIITRKTASDYLSDLSIKNNNIVFSKTKQEYTVKVDKKTNKLDLSAIAEDENATVTIKGNKNIKNGSKVTIEVESTDGSVRVYTLNIQKTGSVDVGIILILIMILAILSAIFKYIQVKRKVNTENNA